MNENNRIVVGIGDLKTGQAPSVIRTTLGSCIAVCLYDQQKKIGGMLHLMMADSRVAGNRPDMRRAKYADTGIPDLIDDLKNKHNVEVGSLKAKIFGGAKVLKVVTANIGEENEEAARKILKGYNISIVAAKTGGEKGYQVDFSLETGKIQCRIFGQEPEEY